MRSYECKARAKINLSLDILSKREDGYHDLKMIMQTVNFGDFVYIERKGTGIQVLSDSKYAPAGARNIAYKAAKEMCKRFEITDGIKIILKKKIPVASGLAGGSTDAAAVLIGINRIFALGCTDEALAEVGKTLGADVPYCIYGGTMLAEGTGEKLTRLPAIPEADILIVRPEIIVSTKWVYEKFKLKDVKDRPDTNLLIKAIENKDIVLLAKNMKNVLESVTEVKYPIISQIKLDMINMGADGSMMSGSGPSVFGIFTDKEAGKACYEHFKKLDNVKSIYTKITNKIF